ncbi:MAG: enoyl-CoA hydratase/isomerase family protein [Bacteroidetes bacterium]|nr:enoyl-CoA hydratase/isomerase family protein [Bacteroidota bacterium]
MTTITEQGFVSYEVSEVGVGTITFGHPLSNSLPGKILRKLADTITELGKQNEVKVLVIKSEGDKAFCAGASFDELMTINDFQSGKAFFSGFAHVINACRTCPKFIIGRVQGKAVGGGVGLASACDYCFATQNADIKLSELAVGIGPFVVGPAVERKIGLSAMSELAINATEWRSAEWAKVKGLFAQIYNSSSEMDIQINMLTLQLAKSNPEAMLLLKQVFWQGTNHWNELLIERAEISGRLIMSDYTRNAIKTFKKK